MVFDNLSINNVTVKNIRYDKCFYNIEEVDTMDIKHFCLRNIMKDKQILSDVSVLQEQILAQLSKKSSIVSHVESVPLVCRNCPSLKTLLNCNQCNQWNQRA